MGFIPSELPIRERLQQRQSHSLVNFLNWIELGSSRNLVYMKQKRAFIFESKNPEGKKIADSGDADPENASDTSKDFLTSVSVRLTTVSQQDTRIHYLPTTVSQDVVCPSCAIVIYLICILLLFPIIFLALARSHTSKMRDSFDAIRRVKWQDIGKDAMGQLVEISIKPKEDKSRAFAASGEKGGDPVTQITKEEFQAHRLGIIQHSRKVLFYQNCILWTANTAIIAPVVYLDYVALTSFARNWTLLYERSGALTILSIIAAGCVILCVNNFAGNVAFTTLRAGYKRSNRDYTINRVHKVALHSEVEMQETITTTAPIITSDASVPKPPTAPIITSDATESTTAIVKRVPTNLLRVTRVTQAEAFNPSGPLQPQSVKEPKLLQEIFLAACCDDAPQPYHRHVMTQCYLMSNDKVRAPLV